MESFGRYIAVLMVTALLFAVPVQQGTAKLRRSQNIYAAELVREFTEKAARQGKITLQEWELLNKRLQEGNGLSFPEISVGEEKESGENRKYYRITYHDDIKEILFEEGCYPLRPGDILMVEIRGKRAEWYECVWQSV